MESDRYLADGIEDDVGLYDKPMEKMIRANAGNHTNYMPIVKK